MRKSYILALGCLVVLLTTLVLGGCSSPQKEQAPKEETQEPEDAFKVALITPGPVTDGGWCSQAYRGLLNIEKELGAEVSNIEVKSKAEAEESLRDYAAQGYDLVIAHSYEYQDPAKKVAPEFPKTVFITSGGTNVLDNLSPIIMRSEEFGYLMGVAAAKLSKTGKIGAIGSIEMPAIRKTLIGYEAGAKATDPGIEVITTYLGTQTDMGKAKEATFAQIDAGVDIIIPNADAAGPGVLQAVEEARKQGKDVWAFGTYNRWAEKYPEFILADGWSDYGIGLPLVAKTVKEGTFKPGIIKFGIADAVQFFWNDALLGKVITDEVKEAVEKAKQDIINGTIIVPTGDY